MEPAAPARRPFLTCRGWGVGLAVLAFLLLAFLTRHSSPALPMWVMFPVLLLPLPVAVGCSALLHRDALTLEGLSRQYLIGAVGVTLLALGALCALSLLWVLVLLLMGFDASYGLPGMSPGTSVGRYLLLAMVGVPLPEAVATWYALSKGKTPDQPPRGFVANASYVALGYGTAKAASHALLIALSLSAAPWTALTALACLDMALSVPVQVAAAYGAALLLVAADLTGQSPRPAVGIAFGWGVRVVFYLVSFAWQAALLPWWGFLLVALFDALCFAGWAVVMERRLPDGRLPDPSAYHYSVQVEEMGAYSPTGGGASRCEAEGPFSSPRCSAPPAYAPHLPPGSYPVAPVVGQPCGSGPFVGVPVSTFHARG